MPDIITKSEAKARGLKRYFTGKPCKRGHMCERSVSTSNCLECAGERLHQYNEANRDQIRERKRQYYEATETSVWSTDVGITEPTGTSVENTTAGIAKRTETSVWSALSAQERRRKG